MSGGNSEWINRQVRTDEDRREYERERLILWSLESIHAVMDDAGITQSDIAVRLGTSRSNVSRAFSGRSNITLGTIADLAWASGMRAVLKLEPLRSGEFISSPVRLVRSAQPKVVSIKPMDSKPIGPSGVDAEWLIPCVSGEK